jgi:prolyl-tRNA editing enzyme YbaK/EbsC (Cys-tRNA(Pro) deacylase)
MMERMQPSVTNRAPTSALDALGVEYERIPCDPSLSDTVAFARHYGYALERIVNTIVVRSRTDPPQLVACVLLGSTRVDVNGAVRRRMGVRKASFASAQEVGMLTGMPSGGVSPFGLPPGLPVWIDDRVVGGTEPLIVGSGERASKLLVAPDAIAAIADAEVISGLAAAR